LNQQCFQFGEFRLDPSNRLLRHGDAPVSLSPKAFDALVYLVQNSGRLLTREELIRTLWPDSYVEEGNLSVHIFQVRRALGTAADGKAYIQTVPKKGYRFNADVNVVDHPLNGTGSVGFDPGDVSLAHAPPGETGATGATLSGAAAAEMSAGAQEAPRTSVLSTSELPADKPGPIRSRSWELLAVGAIGLVLLAIIAQRVLPTRHNLRKTSSPVRLTSFSPELFVSAAAISPDGKTLAYANPSGLFLEELATKETRSVHAPASGLRISNLSWFPDGSRLLATGVEPDAVTPTVWIISANATIEPERVGAFQRGVMSPDGSQIALVNESSGGKELLLLPTAGGQLRRIATIPAGEDLGTVFWSVDGHRVDFVAARWDSQFRGNQGFIRSVDPSTGKIREILSAANLSGDAIDLSDGRLVYGQLLGANPAGSYGGELRQVRVDAGTGQVLGDSVSLGRWTEELAGLSSSVDGRRLVFRTVVRQHTVYAGDLDVRRESLSRVHRLTLGQGRDDFPRAWTPDSKSIFFDSNRNGKWEIFKQAADEISDEPFLQGANDEFSPRMSPDGRSLLYLDRPRDWREPAPVRLMRIAMSERFPQFVLQTSGYSEWGLRFECAQTPGASCVLAQRTGNEIAFRRFDPERGFNSGPSEALKLQLDSRLKISWALAPDGSRLAWIISDAPDARIHVASLPQSGSARTASARPQSDISLKQVSHLHALNWSPDGQGWYVTTRLPASWKIIYVDGIRSQILWEGQGDYSPEAWPSPDGRHLAFSRLEQDSNVWMLENF
jgi:DNA-binding winged helix-turn-helix (wHTH) protein/Tol biopolymer transport system component